MKILLVTSQVTYVPRNYFDLFEELLRWSRSHLAGLVLVDNFSPQLFGTVAGLAFMGAPGVAGHILRNIVELPGRRREKAFEAAGLPILRVKSMNDESVIRWVRENQIDLVVNLRTRSIYKREILSAPRLGCLNIHHGLLPEYRGTLCDLYALWEGRPAGFTIHQMNEKIDAGRILVREEVSSPGEKNFPKYLSRASRIEGFALSRLIDEIANLGRLPDGIANESKQVVRTRNPSAAQIRQMKRAGMVL